MSASRFDWEAAHARLDLQRQALEPSGALSAEETRRRLEERARQLAVPRARPVATELTDVLVFLRAGERYGVEALHVKEVLPTTSPTLLPGRRTGLAGIANHRGRVLAVVDLGGLRPRSSGPPEGRIVVVEAPGLAFGILADEITGIVPIDGAEMTGGAPGSEIWVKATTGSMVCVLDLEALGHDPRVRVEE